MVTESVFPEVRGKIIFKKGMEIAKTKSYYMIEMI